MGLFEQISVNIQTGAIAYPKLEGFELDMDRVYETAKLHYPHCNGSLEMAVKHAIHGQLAAHQGAARLFRFEKGCK
jgi:hypothetical protein